MSSPDELPSRRRRAVMASVVLIGTSLVLLAVAEVAVRVLEIGPTFQVVYREVYRPSQNATLGYELMPGARDGADRISRAGLRDREFPLHKPAGVFRIVAIGDSVTYGPPDSREAAWPKQLEQVLNQFADADAPRFEVLNLGVTGYNVEQVAERLAVSGLPHEPDLIVYGYVLNDPQQMSWEAEALERLRFAEQARFRDEVARGVLRWLARSRLYLLIRHAFYRPSGASEVGPPEDPQYEAFHGGDERGRYFRDLHLASESRQRLLRGLDRIDELSGTMPVLVGVFPLLLPKSGDYPLRDVHAQVSDLCRERGFTVEDLAPAFDVALRELGHRWVVGDFLHPAPIGHRVAAVAIHDALVRHALVPGNAGARARLAGDESGYGAVARVLGRVGG